MQTAAVRTAFSLPEPGTPEHRPTIDREALTVHQPAPVEARPTEKFS